MPRTSKYQYKGGERGKKVRKLALLVGVSVFLISGGTAAGLQVPEAHGDVSQYAVAEWRTVEDGNKVIYFAAGMNRTGADWPFTAYVGRAVCRRVDNGHHVGLRCTGRAQPARLNPGDFVVDPALNSAQLKVVDGDFTHEVSWQATPDTPQPYFHQHLGTDVGFLVTTAMSRRADATGNLFGQELEDGRRSYIVQGVVAEVYLNERFDIGHFHFRDGTLFFSARY